MVYAYIPSYSRDWDGRITSLRPAFVKGRLHVKEKKKRLYVYSIYGDVSQSLLA